MARKKPSNTRERVLEAAHRLFLEKGFSNASITDIRTLTGVSNGSIFHFFPVKEDLGFAVYSDVRADFWNQVVNAMVAHDDPLDGVEAAAREVFKYQRTKPGAAAFMSDVSGSTWIHQYAETAHPLYVEITGRGLAWAMPHMAAGRLPKVSPDAFIALVSGAPQWISRMVRIGLVDACISDMENEVPALIRKAFTP